MPQAPRKKKKSNIAVTGKVADGVTEDTKVADSKTKSVEVVENGSAKKRRRSKGNKSSKRVKSVDT
jgi:hypothetical protein